MAEIATKALNARDYFKKGNKAYEKEEFQKAIEYYSMAIVLDPMFSEAYFNRGLALYYLKEYERAIKDFEKALELDPKNPVIYLTKGDAYYKMQEYKKAIAEYEKAIMLNPNYMKAYYNMGLAYAALQDYAKAIQQFSEAIRRAPNFADAYYLRGLAYEFSGNSEMARKDYEACLKLNPEHQEAKFHLESLKTGGEKGKESAVNIIRDTGMTFKDVAGMDKLKKEIMEFIVLPIKYPELSQEYGVLGGGGILLYGPPGCGKTYLMRAAAGEAGVTFINVKISDVLSMYVGETEKNIHKIFEAARKNAPAILFIDEVDAIGGRREKLDSNTQYLKLAINQLLMEMDGLESNNVNVLVVAATNAPWDVDPALRRSGRFSKAIYVPEPDLMSRLKILQLHAKKKGKLSRWIAWFRIALATWGYSAADLKGVVDQAARYPWREAIEKGRKRPITTGDFIRATNEIKSTLGPWYEQAKKQIGKQEEKTIIDGKEHVTIKESPIAPGEREMFRPLLKTIDRRNQWWYKGLVWFIRTFAKVFPLPF